ncbi:MAG: hypothetical protein MAG794_01554 [Gammaproteobacteria bacterium]|nr:hypothetical protein [Gammaproteobacteria bacterium]
MVNLRPLRFHHCGTGGGHAFHVIRDERGDCRRPIDRQPVHPGAVLAKNAPGGERVSIPVVRLAHSKKQIDCGRYPGGIGIVPAGIQGNEQMLRFTRHRERAVVCHETLDDPVRKRCRAVPPDRLAGGPEQGHQAASEQRVIREKTLRLHAASKHLMHQPARFRIVGSFPEAFGRPLCEPQMPGIVEHFSARDECLDGQGVEIDVQLFVAQRLGPPVARSQQLLPQRLQCGQHSGRRGIAETRQCFLDRQAYPYYTPDVPAFAARSARDFGNALEFVHAKEFLRPAAQNIFDLRALPAVAGALHAADLRVLCGIKSALRGHHVSGQIPGDILGRIPVEHFVRGLERFGIKLQELGIVIQHLFEMRYRPVAVRAVAMESAADMVVDPAVRHRVQCFDQGLAHFRLRGQSIIDQQKPEQGGLREFSSTPAGSQSAVFGIELLQESPTRLR